MLSSPAFCSSLLPSCFLPRDGKPGFHSSTELAPFPQHCILIMPYRVWPSYFTQAAFAKPVGFSSNKGPWSSITQERHACRPDCLVAGCHHMCWARAVQRGMPGAPCRYSSLSVCHSSQPDFSERLRMPPRKGSRTWAPEHELLLYTDICNDDQVFGTVFHPTSLPLGLRVFSSMHSFPLVSAQVVTNSNIFSERKRNWR